MNDLPDEVDGSPTPWKMFFMKWVKPVIQEQYEQGAEKEKKKKKRCLDMKMAISYGIRRMLKKAKVGTEGMFEQINKGTSKTSEELVNSMRNWDRLKSRGLDKVPR